MKILKRGINALIDKKETYTCTCNACLVHFWKTCNTQKKKYLVHVFNMLFCTIYYSGIYLIHVFKIYEKGIFFSVWFFLSLFSHPDFVDSSRKEATSAPPVADHAPLPTPVLPTPQPAPPRKAKVTFSPEVKSSQELIFSWSYCINMQGD